MKNQFFSYDEIRTILKKPMSLETRALIALQYASGCRVGELVPYKHKYKKNPTTASAGLLKSNFIIRENEISWVMPNFKNKSKKTKNPFVLKEETLLFTIIKKWLTICDEQVFEFGERWARILIKKIINPFTSHALRHSRATHLREFGYDAYLIMDALGHASTKATDIYVHPSQMREIMKQGLLRKKGLLNVSENFKTVGGLQHGNNGRI